VLFRSTQGLGHIINGSDLKITGNLAVGYAIGGTAHIKLVGTGTFSGIGGGQNVSNNLSIDTIGTITLSGSIFYSTRTFQHVQGTIVDSSSTITLSNCTWVPNGVTTWGNLSLNNGTVTMTGNATVKNFSSVGLGQVLNSISTLTVTGNLSHASYPLSGTCAIILSGSNNTTWSGNGTMSNSLTINKTGTLTLSGNISYGGASSTLTYTATLGAIIPGTTTFTSITGTTYNISSTGFTLYNFTANTGTHTINTGTITINNNLTLGGNVSFAGTGGWSTANFSDSTAARILTLKDGSTYTVRSALTMVGTNASPFVIQSSSVTLRALFNLEYGATQAVQFVRATRIDSSGGQTVWDTVGTIVSPLTDTINWNSGTRPSPVYSIRMV
jgi:hypothetical protein